MKPTVLGISLAVLSFLVLSLSSCGGGSSKAGRAAAVKTIFTDDPSVVVSDTIDLTVDFTFSTDTVVHDNHNVILFVRVPRGLQFDVGTARIDEIGGTDSVAPTSELCQNGDTYLRFDLGQNVLANAAEQSGGVNGRLIMELAGNESVGTVSIEALAGYDFEGVTASCAQGLVPQDTTPFTVL